MAEPYLVDTYELPTVSNICNQVLREVITLPKVSMAHVIMSPGNVSLLHQHLSMSEIYFILEGEGILFHGEKALQAEKGAYQVLPPKTPHKLRNTGDRELEHLVFAAPPFNPEEVYLLKDTSEEPAPDKFLYEKPPFSALDGAIVYELMTVSERRELDVALAIGFLPRNRKATPHYHKISEEVYYITSGQGRARVEELGFNIKKGSVVYVPANAVHALENTSSVEDLNVLCLSSPSYTDGDFYRL